MPLLQEYYKLFEENTEVKKIIVNGSIVWPAKITNYSEPFYIEDVSGQNNIISVQKTGSSTSLSITLESSTDKVNWITLETVDSSNTSININIPANGKVYLRCSTNKWGDSTAECISFATHTNTNYFDIGGNIMSLVYGNNFRGNEKRFPSNNYFVFGTLFKNNIYLKNTNNLILPATTLVGYCYAEMFYGCTSLVSTPELPATTLTNYCYRRMFYGCTSLVSTPELPATTLATSCYNEMFYGCTSLVTVTNLPATTAYSQCYSGMFRACTALVTAQSTLPATTLANNCYDLMFYGCSSLVTAPTLPATTLVNYCYINMFSGCTSLNTVTCLATSGIDTNGSTSNWLNNVARTGTFTKAAGVTWPTGSNGIPSGWTVVEV